MSAFETGDLSKRIASLSPEQRALLERRMGASPSPARARGLAEPIAIVGMGCRFPGQATSPAAFWRLLVDGVDAVSEVPADRWNADALYHPDPGAAGKMSTRWGGFLTRIEEFDAAFFGIAPREAARMDPQQRLLLEVAWEALEEAGQPVEHLAGRAAGVFLGIHSLSSDYYLRQAGSLDDVDVYTSTGVAHSIMANRLSYLLDLRGPSLVVDTACSSSLVAVHLAVQSLRLGECDLALAGGANLILSPETTVAFSKLNMMAADGRCKTFDARADGFVRSEGCGVVVLRRLADALAEGDPVVALIRGSAVNQDGATNGITAPSGLAQEAVVRRALANAGVEGRHVSFVETHGTGTALGDPIEVEALQTTLGQGTGPCLLGAVKTNLGHMEAAAGIAGLIKAALCLRHRFVPPNLHFQVPNPHLELARSRFVVPTDGWAWGAAEGTPRLAGVSSFGFGGTNAHLVLEEAPSSGASAAEAAGLALPLPLSARSQEALQELAAAYAAFVADPEEGGRLRMLDLAHTAGARRSQHAYRAVVVGTSREEWAAALHRVSARPVPSPAPETAPGLVFVYSGQGAQWAGMGRELHRTEPVFRAVLDRAETEIRKRADWSLLEALAAPESEGRLRRTDVAQPALFAVQAALTELLRNWGVEPEAVLGHSAGEVAAAWAAGVLPFEEALRVATERGRLMQAAAGQGDMASIELSVPETERLLAGHRGRIEVAAVNAPGSTVVSGDAASLQALLGVLEARGVHWKRLNGGFAFHSHQMEPFQEELRRLLAGLVPGTPRRALFSTVSGRRAEAGDYGAAYWARNIRERVRFTDAMAACMGEGHQAFLEVGPHPVLVPMIRRCGVAGVRLAALWTLRRDEGERQALLETLGGIYRLGHRVDWSHCIPPGGRVVPLPAYPWQRKRFWLDGRAAAPVPAPVSAVTAASPETERLEDLTYAVEWPRRERDSRGRPAGDGPGSWLILADRGGLGARLADRLREQGETCQTLLAAEDGSTDRLARVLREEWKSNGVPRRGVVHLWSLDLPASDQLTPSSWERAQALRGSTVAALARSVADTPGPRIWLVTRGAQAAGAPDAPVAVAQAPLWGLGRVLALEQPESWGGLIDLDPAAISDDVSRLLQEIVDPDGEDQVAFRDGERRVARLLRATLGTEAPPAISETATYLVTGGLGALGLVVARWLVERGARHLVLTSRTGLGPDPQDDPSAARRHQAVAALRAMGARVTVVAADAGDPAAMAAVFEAFGDSMPPLRGVVHAAGVLQVAPVARTEPAVLRDVFRPKVAGAWTLHELTRGLPLDFFVLFSSAAAVWGSKGLGSYAAANHFLDALAQHRHACGLPALSVSWGWWAEGGMGAGETEAIVRRSGIRALSSGQALGVLERLLGWNGQRTVAAVDWSAFKPVYEARGSRALLKAIDAGPAASGRDRRADESDLARRLAQASPEDRRELLAAAVAREVAALLGFDSAEAVDPAQGFFKLGMDSITTVRLRSRLESILARPLPPTVAFEYPTVERLAAYLAAEAVPVPPALAAGRGVRSAARATTLPEGLSEDELTAMLAEKLHDTAAGVGAVETPTGKKS